MNNINKIINEEINKFLINEVRYIDTTYSRKKNSMDRFYNQEPIHNNETIRVFHGCSFDTALRFATEGFSGQEIASRKYSYETKMNPQGLFVSTDFNVAKDFSNDYDTLVIIEFSVKAKDLDTPVWNGQGTFFGQNTNPQSFHSKKERQQQWERYQENARNNEYEYVRNSDNPAMADKIFNNIEHQALFMGNINPNQIKRFWIKTNDDSSFKPLKRTDFLKKYSSELKKLKPRYYLPNEDYKDIDDHIERTWKNQPQKSKDRHIKQNDVDKHKKNMKNNLQYSMNNYPKNELIQTLKRKMFPKQIRQMIGNDEYENYLNNIY